MIGASGAIAAVLGAYLVWFPHSRVHTLVFLGFFITMAELPALVFLGFWFVLQFFQGTLSLAAASEAGGVAWFAHIGRVRVRLRGRRLAAHRPVGCEPRPPRVPRSGIATSPRERSYKETQSMPVPLFDLTRQYRPLREDIRAALDRRVRQPALHPRPRGRGLRA